MVTANEEYLDAVLRHQIGIRRYAGGEIKRLIEILERADAELVDKLRKKLPQFAEQPHNPRSDRWKELLRGIRALRQALIQEQATAIKAQLQAFANSESDREWALLQASIPIEYAFAKPQPSTIRALIDSKPFHGKLLKEWFEQLRQSDQARLIQAVQLGIVQGESTDDIVRRIVGTKAHKFTDGILSITRREATTITRTAINHISNAAREQVWQEPENAEIISVLIWNSVLDGRTSAICRARDGHAAPTTTTGTIPPGLPKLEPPGARPPAHLNCRSVMVAYIDGVALVGNRPTITDVRTRKTREIDFRIEAKRQGRPIQEIRREWARNNIGSVPANVTYQEFLMRQSDTFQDQVLGKAQAKLFRSGKIRLDQFVDRAGNELTLEELNGDHPRPANR